MLSLFLIKLQVFRPVLKQDPRQDFGSAEAKNFFDVLENDTKANLQEYNRFTSLAEECLSLDLVVGLNPFQPWMC